MVYFNGEVNVFWGVDYVKMVIFLEIGSCSRLDSDIMFSFLFYEVYCWSVVMYFV